MVMLLGLCLVVSGDFGNRLIFRYPPLQSTSTAGGAPTFSGATPSISSSSSAPASSGRPSSTSSSSPSVPSSVVQAPITSSSSASAHLLSTGPLSKTFIPIPLPTDDDDPDDVPPPLPPSLLSSAVASAHRRSSPGAGSGGGSGAGSQPLVSSPPTSSSSLIGGTGLANVKAPPVPLGDKEDVWGVPVYEFTRLFSPLSSHLSSSLFDVAVNAVRFLSFPLHLPVESRHELTMFNVVFILKADTAFTTREPSTASSPSLSSSPSSNVTSVLLDLYSTVLIQLSRALEHEQKRCGFLSVESSRMTHLREVFLSSLHSNPQTPSPHAALSSLLIDESPLAHHLHDAYQQLVRLEWHFWTEEERGRGGRKRRKAEEGEVEEKKEAKDLHVHVLINDWLHLHCTLSPSAVPSPLLSSSSSQLSPQSPIRPYQTLLLTTPRSSLLSSLPPDSSPLLSDFIQQLNPTHSFLSLSSSLSLPLSSLLLLAHHLVQWGKARVIDTLQDSDTFTVSPPPPHLTPSLLQSFAITFPSSSLPLFLSSFYPPRPLSSHLSQLSPHAKQLYMEQLIWALEQSLLVQLHLRLYNVGVMGDVDKGVDRKVEEGDDRHQWTEFDWVLYLRRYGDGQATLTEIHWWERPFITRTELIELIHRQPQHFLLVQA